MGYTKIELANMILSLTNSQYIRTIQLKMQVLEELFEEIDPANKMIYASRYNESRELDEILKGLAKEIRQYEAALEDLP